ncbi:hypothetical protein BP6252_12134 [Coleophoma cylindrospora]|uniref:Protein kinase domain-containing protein n=1 Tax=Coleophoma cylindrospora TaxID=1849047 RepID=A0A3D8QGA8_9HELO|nr:hypothetical protein BP6252_12134 [Coleophoma cylindrospora]
MDPQEQFVTQTLSIRYIDKTILTQLLRSLFGNNFRVKQTREEEVTLTVPQRLTEAYSPFTLHGIITNSHTETMQSLKEQILLERRENYDGKIFVPNLSLDRLMTTDCVRRVLQECDKINAHDRSAVEQCINDGNFKVFAILLIIGEVDKLLEFVKNDQFQDSPSNLDHKLPLDLGVLKRILPPATAIQFHTAQWEYASPVFPRHTLPRHLDNKTVLPILSERHISEGAFANVYEVILHDSHRKFGQGPGWKCVRKEFLVTVDQSTARSNFELELRNLSIIGQIKHPCIIDILGAYTYLDKHNLMFPLKGGTLETLLKLERPVCFKENSNFMASLANLSSALQELHEYFAERINLSLIGCHHDIKPTNIFVEDQKFILADFGLSYFKDISQSSKSLHKTGFATYLAPECEALHLPNIQKGKAGRKSDIWSFGCIILEVLTYMTFDEKRLNTFRESRQWDAPNWTFESFHCGNKPNPAVDHFLDELLRTPTTPKTIMVNLIRNMLSMDPNQRPSAREVTKTLQCITFHESLRLVDELWASLGTQTPSQTGRTIIHIQTARYECWKEMCGILDGAHISGDQEMPLTVSNFQSILDVIKELRDALDDCKDFFRHEEDGRIFIPLHHINNRLVALLPSGSYDKYQTSLVQRMIVDTEEIRYLEGVRDAFAGDSLSPRVGRLANVKLMSELTAKVWKKASDEQDLSFDVKHVEIKTKQGLFNHGVVQTPEGAQRKVIIEWLHFGASIVPETEGIERAKRVEGIAKCLNSIDSATGLQALHCSGFFLDDKQPRFGLLFDVPSVRSLHKSNVHESMKAVSLAEFLKTSSKDQRPPLGDRFRLAFILARSIAEFHKVGWLHKNLSSYNVLFFYAPPSSVTIGHPYLVGFSHSRLGDRTQFTEGPLEGDRDYQDYQHPEYLANKQRYRMEFDYYSLGIILMEIAAWKHISKLTNDDVWKTKTPANFSAGLIKEVKEDLRVRFRHTMGDCYCDAMERCMTGDFGISKDGTHNTPPVGGQAALHQSFSEQVVDQLAACAA